jgi:hypothetical protein
VTDGDEAVLPYCYYVAYAAPLTGFGSLRIRSDRPADRFEVVSEFRRTVQRTTGAPADLVVILWWQRLHGDEPDRSRGGDHG